MYMSYRYKRQYIVHSNKDRVELIKTVMLLEPSP